MSVYVDPLINYGAGDEAPRCFRNVESCHMYADTLDELHAFARKIGLQRSWFQNHRFLPHYDLIASKRGIAIAFGAISHTSKEMVAFKKRITSDTATLPSDPP